MATPGLPREDQLLSPNPTHRSGHLLSWLWRSQGQSEEGQGLAEYALILSLIAVVAIAALVFLGTTISSILSQIGANI
jgi:pilus assembly protein Flp/PilA